MQTYTANEAKTRFGELLDRAQREPVRVMWHNRLAGVMVSAEDYEAMRAFYADRCFACGSLAGQRVSRCNLSALRQRDMECAEAAACVGTVVPTYGCKLSALGSEIACTETAACVATVVPTCG